MLNLHDWIPKTIDDIIRVNKDKLKLEYVQFGDLLHLNKPLPMTSFKGTMEDAFLYKRIESLVFTGKRSVKSQFIKRSDREKLIAVFNSNPRKRNVQSDLGAGMKSCASCEQYLNQLRSQNQNLPMQGNTYDKSKISRICGFSREVIYNNKKVKKLLDDYLAEYYERNNLIVLPSDRLRKYIDELKMAYSNPPLKASGKLNKVSIAKICDFDRHVLYRDPVVIELLNNLESSLLLRA